MLRNIISGQSTQEIYKIDADMHRGTIVTKNLTTKVATKADGVGIETYFVDFDSQPMGYQSDMEISGYTDDMDIVKANTYAVLKKLVSGTWATDQVDATDLAVGDYLVAGKTTGKGTLIKAVATDVSPYKYIGTYDDAGNTLYSFEVVEPHTVA
jgi:hypothetical protein